MSDWKTHLIGGVIISAAFAYLARAYFTIDLVTIVPAVILILFFSLLPDCDHENSKITMLLEVSSAIMVGYAFFGGILVDWFVKHNWITQTLADTLVHPRLLLFGILLLLFTMGAEHIGHHRGRIHSIPAALIFSFLASILLFNLGLQTIFLGAIAFVSYWSHLILDGIPLKMGKEA